MVECSPCNEGSAPACDPGLELTSRLFIRENLSKFRIFVGMQDIDQEADHLRNASDGESLDFDEGNLVDENAYPEPATAEEYAELDRRDRLEEEARLNKGKNRREWNEGVYNQWDGKSSLTWTKGKGKKAPEKGPYSKSGKKSGKGNFHDEDTRGKSYKKSGRRIITTEIRVGNPAESARRGRKNGSRRRMETNFQMNRPIAKFSRKMYLLVRWLF